MKLMTCVVMGDQSFTLPGICFKVSLRLIQTNLFIIQSEAARLLFISCYVQYLANEILSYLVSRNEIAKISRNESYKPLLNGTMSTHRADRVFLIFLYLVEKLSHLRIWLNKSVYFLQTFHWY